MTSVRAKLSLAVLLTISLVGVSLAQFPVTDIYFAKEIWTGKGEPIRDGAMVVVDGTITAVGPRADISIPPLAVPHELKGQVIIPGLVAAQTTLSGAEAEDRTITPEIRALDGFDFFADRNDLLKSGVTTVQVSPGETRLMPGVGGVVQLAGEDILERILADEESLRIVLSESSRQPPRIYEPPVGPVAQDRPLETTRPQLATLSGSLAGLRQIFKRATRNETYVSDVEEQDAIVDAVAALIKKKTPIRITAVTAPKSAAPSVWQKSSSYRLSSSIASDWSRLKKCFPIGNHTSRESFFRDRRLAKSPIRRPNKSKRQRSLGRMRVS